VNEDAGLTGILVTALATLAVALGFRFLGNRRGRIAAASAGTSGESISGEKVVAACLNVNCQATFSIDRSEAERLTAGKRAMTSYFNDDFAMYGAPVEDMPMPCPRCGRRVAWVEVEMRRKK
jgi:multisubunit Na+/H+ antiporter MnhB subunit